MRGVISSASIVFLCAAAGAFLAILLSLATPSFSSEHHLLPSLPAAAEEIVGIELGGFYKAEVAVRAIDGKEYVYPFYTSNATWQVGSVSGIAEYQPCRRRSVNRLRAVAGEIVDCREFQAIGEWCPAPMQSIAINVSGEVWELVTQQPCLLTTVPNALLSGAIGFILGIVIVAIRRLASQSRTGMQKIWLSAI